ncbi:MULTISPECIES: RNA 2',3'-cyclic phosphodiesterase [Desulfobacula]|uniref:RNA 2',3'-cyclic phosphodiesterase n=2 Tax=Desulfobacula TaxID=28222 RepID=K0NQU4_DESTT|nr:MULTISPECIES: RNA 2',3'-cyclic phosphodiesterase [Desulfobacula]CCK82503.1 2?-5?RNA ligase [Desulfobacula toluolica Tol2]SDU49067.1 2'-5' RNA ligase [Desulfobacula phenolica]
MNSDNRHIRAFIAISLPDEIKGFLHDIQKQLRKSGIKASWPKPAAMHLTLKFIGAFPVSKIDTLKTIMIREAGRIPVHTLFAAGIGVFPSVKNTRVIWSGTRGQTDILENLANQLENSLFKEMRIKKNNQRFAPHLTLARIKQPVFPKKMVRLIEDFKDVQSDEFRVSKVKLFQSELTACGAVHQLVFSAPLKN